MEYFTPIGRIILLTNQILLAHKKNEKEMVIIHNLQRLQMETKGVTLEQAELIIYLEENDLAAFTEYNPQSATNKKNIYQSALSILESIANNPEHMRNIKDTEMSVSDFSDNLQSRIDQLEYKVRKLLTDEQASINTSIFTLFNE